MRSRRRLHHDRSVRFPTARATCDRSGRPPLDRSPKPQRHPPRRRGPSSATCRLAVGVPFIVGRTILRVTRSVTAQDRWRLVRDADGSGARALLAALPRPLGFVPTMGALHDGHLELVRAGARTLRVGRRIDLRQPAAVRTERRFRERYPRDLERDRAALGGGRRRRALRAAASRDVSAPASPPSSTSDPVGARFEGAVRPGHFRGVPTVVAKLLNIVAPDVLVSRAEGRAASGVCAR